MASRRPVPDLVAVRSSVSSAASSRCRPKNSLVGTNVAYTHVTYVPVSGVRALTIPPTFRQPTLSRRTPQVPQNGLRAHRKSRSAAVSGDQATLSRWADRPYCARVASRYLHGDDVDEFLETPKVIGVPCVQRNLAAHAVAAISRSTARAPRALRLWRRRPHRSARTRRAASPSKGRGWKAASAR